jgi:hypothetical protein
LIFDSLPVDAISCQVDWGIYTLYLFRCANYYRHRVGIGVSSNESMAMVGGWPAAMVDAAGGGGEQEGDIARILDLI